MTSLCLAGAGRSMSHTSTAYSKPSTKRDSGPTPRRDYLGRTTSGTRAMWWEGEKSHHNPTFSAPSCVVGANFWAWLASTSDLYPTSPAVLPPSLTSSRALSGGPYHGTSQPHRLLQTSVRPFSTNQSSVAPISRAPLWCRWMPQPQDLEQCCHRRAQMGNIPLPNSAESCNRLSDTTPP